ncbi:hypothetical protein HA466_0056880 [Hirschfeldia incana]|nr:hypothetical protein HA466_0056880 [Hirschfeldia incana]
MTPNLRSMVAKAYRVRQGRAFCSSSSSSSAPNNPIGNNKGKELDFMPFLDTLNNMIGWVITGYAAHFGWELLRMSQIDRDAEKDDKQFEIEVDRFIDEMRRHR